MRIQKSEDYVKFFVDLNMGDNVTFLSFLNNEKLVLKRKLQNKKVKKEPILNGLEIINELTLELEEIGEKKVLEKYDYSI
ncbi:MAG: hypothetical protein P8X83_08025 [Nitrosopumilaceae archaeon]